MSISQTIYTELKEALLDQQKLPCALTLNALSEHYQVSPMPVRQAIESLLAEGLLTRNDNGRLAASADAVLLLKKAMLQKAILQKTASKKSLLKKTAEKKTAAQKTAAQKTAAQKGKQQKTLTANKNNTPLSPEQAIRNNVIQRCFSQQEDFLREAATAEAFDVGRTVVRQIFSRLAGEGLLTHVPRCGWRVRPLSEAEMHEYLAVRELLELKALDLARPHFNAEELQQLLEANQPAKRKKPARLDLDLHQYWITRCGNYYIQDFFSRYGGFYNALFNYAAVDSKAKTLMATEHRDIIHCLLNEDWRGARKALQVHIRDQREAVSQMIMLSKK